jgi:DNA primase
VANPTAASGAPVLDRHESRVDGTVPRERLVAAHQEAARFFADQLAAPAGASPRTYLQTRGFGPLLGSSRWELGYAPASWTGLTNHLRGRGFDTAELLTAGLAVRARTGGMVDRFRDRLMLTIHNLDGDPVGFVGRAAPHPRGYTPKYLNSPRTVLFDKSALLFGLGEQQAALQAGAVPVLVEGPFDALAVSLANQERPAPELAAVAPCGTALTATQVDALGRFADSQVLVAFDNDPAGQCATAAAYQLLAPHFTQLRAVVAPEGTDPSQLLQDSGPQALLEGLSHHRPLADAVLDHGLTYWLSKRDNAEACVAAIHELAPTLANLRPDDVGRQAGRFAQALGIDHAVVSRALADALTTSAATKSTGRRRSSFSTAPFPTQRAAPSLGLA